jgi:hypothetical protein
LLTAGFDGKIHEKGISKKIKWQRLLCELGGLLLRRTISDPTEVLRAVIKSQTIKEDDVIVISTTTPPSGILNIPFVGKNANPVQMDAIFWIETVAKDPQINQDDTDPNSQFFQLQYEQRVILDFDNVHRPHVSVATLVKE